MLSFRITMVAEFQHVVLTYDDYRRLPDDGRRYELLEGEIFVTPAPTTSHQRISRNLEFTLHSHVNHNDLGEILDAPIDVILGRTVVVQPDLVFVSKHRADIITERGVEGPPDLVIEILSPSTQDQDRGPKQQLYARYGIRHYWLLDPKAKTLTELLLESGVYKLIATHSERELQLAPFPQLTIDLGEVFDI